MLEKGKLIFEGDVQQVLDTYMQTSFSKAATMNDIYIVIVGSIMFNIYYINYEKAYEISMLIDNKLIEQRVKETGSEFQGNGKGGLNVDKLEGIPLIGDLLPKINAEVDVSGTKVKKVIDTISVISTKSTILNKINLKAKEVTELSDKYIGTLVKIKNVKLSIINENEILGIKTVLSGALDKIAMFDLHDMELSLLVKTMLNNSAYIIEGEFKDKRASEPQYISIKIPMKAENEMESQYSISDLEIGSVSIIGIYKGTFDKNDLVKRINRFSAKQEEIENQEIEIESDETSERTIKNGKTHFIDVIAIVQDIRL